MNSNLLNKAGFEKLYGYLSLDYSTINSFGGLESNYLYSKYIGIALIIIGIVALIADRMNKKENKENKKKNKKTSTLMIIATLSLLAGSGLFLYYIYIYFYVYLEQYKNFYSELDDDGREMLKEIN